MNPTTLALITGILGTEHEHDIDYLGEVFMADKVGSGSYSEETFKGHIEAVKESGDGYVEFVDGLRTNPSTKTMYVFFIGQGPDGIYGLLEQMGKAGLLKKDKVASAAKIATKARAERQYFRKIWDDLGAEAYTFIEERFAARLSEFRKLYPEIDSEEIKTFKDLLVACGKSTLNVGVTKATEPHTEQECSLALGWRLDIHSAARNGGWDEKLNNGAGGFTKKFLAKQEKAAAGEDTGDDDSESSEDDDSNSDD